MTGLTQKGDAVFLPVRVQPRSSKTGISGMHGQTLRIRLKAAPVDDAANRECCRFVAGVLGIAPSRVSISSGGASRNKTLKVEGLSAEQVRELLDPLL